MAAACPASIHVPAASRFSVGRLPTSTIRPEGALLGQVHGFCDERFEPLAALFRANQDQGVDEGASLAATLGGELVVDLWAGTSDRTKTRPWEKDTLVHVFSTSKVMVNIAVLMVYDRGLLDLDAPVADYWPEFAQNGKGTITARHVLVHRSGLPRFGRSIGFEEAHDWDTMIDVLERAEPSSEPGTETYYHAMTYGFILGEVVRRVSGLPFEEFFRQEIAGPLGADFHFGVASPADQARVANLWYPDPTTTPDEADDPAMTEVEQGDWVVPSRMAAVLPSASGIGNGRSIARIGAVMAMGGELDGRRYLSRATVEEAGTEQSFEEDRLLGWCRYGLGFGLDSEYFRASTPTSMHWGGFGGSLATMDPATGMSVGFAPNRLLLEETPDGMPMTQDRLAKLIRTIGDVSRMLFD
jgi:CubicO group peptidase (beta-lactamase class C family)